MKRNSMPKVAAFMLALALVSTSMLSGTFAKYSSEFSGQDTALVAKWEFGTVIGQDLGNLGAPLEAGVPQKLDLFGHEYNKHIITSDGAFIIAPGVESMFYIVMGNRSDVSAKVEIEFELVSGSALVPMEFNVPEIGGNEHGLIVTPSATWISLGALSAEVLDNIGAIFPFLGFVEVDDGDIILLPSEDDIVLMPVLWRWPFYRSVEGDAEDTLLGIQSASAGDRTKYELMITVKATQVAPGM